MHQHRGRNGVETHETDNLLPYLPPLLKRDDGEAATFLFLRVTKKMASNHISARIKNPKHSVLVSKLSGWILFDG